MINSVNAVGYPSRRIPLLFTATIFLSASLLFFVQPLFTKIVLPYVGGAPAVWTTAMLFFQTVLIAGYLYAHLSTKYLPVVAQVSLHLVLWAAALTFLPLSIQSGWRFDPASPIALQTLALFAVGVGMPFAVLSANAPLIQSWYAKSGGPSADDPYFLYGASNLGSLCALLAFPLAAEPLFGARQIGWGWTTGFVLLGLFLGLSGLAARKGAATQTTHRLTAKPTLGNYGWWLLLAFIPSSLMLAVTTKISTDIGSFPLVWVLPLSLYLLTFVLTFTKKALIPGSWIDGLFYLSILSVVVILTGTRLGSLTMPVIIVLLLSFFFIAMKAHLTLYEARPDESNLTIFYVTMSVGGALGGLFNSILAPTIFTELYELRITIGLAAVLMLVGVSNVKMQDISKAAVAATIIIAPVCVYGLFAEKIDAKLLIDLMLVLLLIGFVIMRHKPISRFVATVAVLGIGVTVTNSQANFKDRSFFGTHLVQDRDGIQRYINGTTLHGAQSRQEIDTGTRPTPLFYYHPNAPMAQIITSDFGRAATDVGIIGLGVGSLACYGLPGQSWQFYEIDAMVDRVARDPSLFTFMSDCAADAPTHIGDARVVLEQQTDAKFDILVVDAYSSDAVPIHLVTNEAVKLYRDRVRANGIVIFHISNRYYDIARPLGRSAEALGLHGRIQEYRGDPADKNNNGSTVAIMSASAETLEPFDATGVWQTLRNDGDRIWTDDYANLLSILRWNGFRLGASGG